jgi:hypothetical protein
MVKMAITITDISTKSGVVYASIRVRAPEIGAQARIDMEFTPPTGSWEADWSELAYDRALIMLDPE